LTQEIYEQFTHTFNGIILILWKECLHSNSQQSY
jgi:hypothetical protein